MPRPFPPPARAAFAPKPRVSELTRRRIGFSGLVVFTFGVLLAPLAHNIGHRADHVHRESHFALALNSLREQIEARAHERAHAEGHPHAHGAGHSAAHDAPPSDEHHDERRGSDPHHGGGSLAHFAAAVLAPAIFVVPPAYTTVERVVPASLESVSDGRLPRGPIQPRAPPA